METDSNYPATDATRLPARERWSRALRALGRVLADPEQTDQVLVFSTYANAGTMPDRIHRFLDHPTGRQLYAEHRTIDARSIDLVALGQLPDGTLGRAYAEFLTSRGLTPDVFENPPEEIHDPRMAYVIQRLRQTHDLWHVVTGYDTDPASEVALQAFTFGQLGAPSSGILAVLGTFRGMSMRPSLARDVSRAYRLGRRAQKLAIFPWEDHWSTPLVDVRRMLGLPDDPVDAAQLGRDVRAVLATLASANPADPPVTSATAVTELEPSAANAAMARSSSDPTHSTKESVMTTTTTTTTDNLDELSRFARLRATRRQRRAIRRAWRAVRRSKRALRRSQRAAA